ncbi:MAG: penicillin-binding protein 2 [Pedobacter sp.]|nr:MAG: penicillin-binding protein 2 [Pedobacter sp.]
MDNLFNRKFVIQGLMIIMALILLGKLFYIQVYTDKYFLQANSNALRKLYQFPARGVILDRNQKILAQNQPTYDLMVTPSLVKDIDTFELCKIIGIDTPAFHAKMKKAIVYSRYQASFFQKLLSVETYATLQEKMPQFKGFHVQKRTIRYYPDSVGAHFLGYVREVSQKDIDNHGGYYKPGDYIGKDGIEKQYEKELRGSKGITHMLYNVHNVPQGSYADGKMDSPAIAGTTLITTLDLELQKLGEQLLQNKSGAVVALEPSSGEVLAYVSSPGYDPNKMVGKEFGNNYPQISTSPYRLLNIRPIAGRYSPGSAFKPLDALLALQDAVVDQNTLINCPGYFKAGNRNFKCEHIDGNTNVRWALSRSCNTYFYSIFARMMTKNGNKNLKSTYEDWQNKVRKFGIGDTLGLDLPGEKAYKLFRRADYDKRFNNRWGWSTILSVSIGQGEIETTPLQMANIMAIIANRGYYFKPHAVKGVGKLGNIDPKYKVKHSAGVDERHYEPVINGMQDAVNTSTGTAIQSRIPNILMVGKTGTVQNNLGKNHSVFIGFAPRDNPKIAIAVIIENAGYGGTYAAPVASYMTEFYINRSIDPNRRIMGRTPAQFMEINLLPQLNTNWPKKVIKPNSQEQPADSLKSTPPPLNSPTASRQPLEKILAILPNSESYKKHANSK